MGIDTKAFVGLGYMLRREDVGDDSAFGEILNTILDNQEEIDQSLKYSAVINDCLCGEWIFIGEYHETNEEIHRIDPGAIHSNGDDIDLEIRYHLKTICPSFVARAKFGVYFGINYS